MSTVFQHHHDSRLVVFRMDFIIMMTMLGIISLSVV